MIAERGYTGLYGGCAINLVLITPEKAIKLVVNDRMRARLSDKNGKISVTNEILAGATAGACQCIVTSPMEMFKIAGQTGIPVSTTWKERTAGRTTAIGKMQGVYTGFVSTLLRDIPFSMFYFPTYALVRRGMSQAFLKPGEDPTFCKLMTMCNIQKFSFQIEYFNNSSKILVMNFGSGLISGLIGALLVTPMDCVKTRIQKKGGIPWVEAFKQVKNEGGVPALFNGGLARGIVVGMLFGAAQVTAIVFLILIKS